MGDERIHQRHHPQIECAPRSAQRFLGFQHDGKFGEIEASNEGESSGAPFGVISIAWAKASPTSRRLTSVNGGGSTSVVANGARLLTSRGKRAPLTFSLV